MIVFHDCFMVKDETNKKGNVFFNFLYNAGFLQKGNLVNYTVNTIYMS
jgi:hypothetical protein